MFYPWTLMATLGLIIPPGPGNWVSPIKKLSISLAACLPSVIAQTTSDWPLKKKQQQILLSYLKYIFLKVYCLVFSRENDANLNSYLRQSPAAKTLFILVW